MQSQSKGLLGDFTQAIESKFILRIWEGSWENILKKVCNPQIIGWTWGWDTERVVDPLRKSIDWETGITLVLSCDYFTQWFGYRHKKKGIVLSVDEARLKGILVVYIQRHIKHVHVSDLCASIFRLGTWNGHCWSKGIYNFIKTKTKAILADDKLPTTNIVPAYISANRAHTWTHRNNSPWRLFRIFLIPESFLSFQGNSVFQGIATTTLRRNHNPDESRSLGTLRQGKAEELKEELSNRGRCGGKGESRVFKGWEEEWWLFFRVLSMGQVLNLSSQESSIQEDAKFSCFFRQWICCIGRRSSLSKVMQRDSTCSLSVAPGRSGVQRKRFQLNLWRRAQAVKSWVGIHY